jgi:hypothetical protein
MPAVAVLPEADTVPGGREVDLEQVTDLAGGPPALRSLPPVLGGSRPARGSSLAGPVPGAYW